MTHKNNCVPHPSLAALDSKEPEMFSDEWIELQVDKLLSKWIAEWRSCFMRWTTIALDLANHPEDRVMTHWYAFCSVVRFCLPYVQSTQSLLRLFSSACISSLNPGTWRPSLVETIASVTTPLSSPIRETLNPRLHPGRPRRDPAALPDQTSPSRSHHARRPNRFHTSPIRRHPSERQRRSSSRKASSMERSQFEFVETDG
jgi:hypothetical protein